MTENTTPDTALDQRVREYLAIRDKLKAIDAAHDAARKIYVETLSSLSGVMLDILEKTGAEGARTSFGTVYTSSKTTASLADPDAFMRFVIANGKFDLMDRKANATAVRDYVNENKQLPPGCNLTTVKTLGVRSPTKGKN
ncbi:MAG: hypothetical protein NVSMB6_25380 [Burkholderiaceae bacterium]